MARIALCGALLLGASAADAKEHVVQDGQTIGRIAKRYQISIKAVCYANGIKQHDPIKPGQRLVIPDRSDKDGTLALATRLAKEHPRETSKPTLRASFQRQSPRRRSGPAWAEYSRSPRRKSYLEITNHFAK